MEQLLKRLVEDVETCASLLEDLVVLKQHELGVRVVHAPDGGGPYIPKRLSEEED